MVLPWARNILPTGAVVRDAAGSDRCRRANACAGGAVAVTDPRGATSSTARTRTVSARSIAGARASGRSAGGGGPRSARSGVFRRRPGGFAAAPRVNAARVATQEKHAARDPSAVDRAASSRRRGRCEPRRATAGRTAVESCVACATASASGGCAVSCVCAREGAGWPRVNAVPRSQRPFPATSETRA